MTRRFNKVLDTVKLNEGIINISGLSEGRKAPLLSLIAKESEKTVFIITANQKSAKDLYEDLQYFAAEKNIYLIPEDERIFLNYEAKSRGFLEARLNGVIKLIQGNSCIVIASVGAAMRKIMPKSSFVEHAFKMMADEEYSLDEIKAKLTRLGYDRVSAIDIKGEYSVRGDILDVYPYDCDNPIRIEFFDDVIDSIREFNKDTQRSIRNLDEVEIYPALQILYDDDLAKEAVEKVEKAYKKQGKKLKGEAAERLASRKGMILENIESRSNNQGLSNLIPYFYENTETLIDYMENDGILIIEDYERARERISLSEKEIAEDFKNVLERGEAAPEDFGFFTRLDDFERILNGEKRLTYVVTPFAVNMKGIDEIREIVNIRTKMLPSYLGNMGMFLDDMKAYKKNGFEVSIICSSDDRVENIKNYLSRNGVYVDKVSVGRLTGGCEFTDEKLVLVSDSDIFNSTKKRKQKKKSKNASPIKSFVDIRRGDYVVHENHGIGRFIEIKQLEIEGIKRDYLKIQYAGDDILYVPVDQMDCVQKYIGGDNPTIKVNKLSGAEWKKTKQKVKSAIQQMAREIMELSAQRKMIEGYAFSQDTLWQKEFEDAFPYEETDDQLKCSEEIKLDMEKTSPMERLLCGDVGYGKTEVAARAIFKCIADGKQAAVLVPTTILASQHFSTFKERFGPFPFKVEMLSRFRNEKQQEKIIDELKKGSVDIIVGTHRLLSKDIKFKDLGLLVIDEEQRFGVQHKEAIKLMRKNVDVLTLSATPIPRTLHMSLIGARDMSVIEEPPEDRYPVQTYVMEQDDEVIRNAIMSEMERGGQTFVVYNRVKDIKRVADRIRKLVPEAEVSIGHGQMSEESLENVIIDFASQQSDVLVCTTIIETGVDMPNVNTMIILDADKFGLSQLYQLRGRVGRSDRIAYAYLMYQKNKVLNEIAEKRLTAIRDFTELGAGFKIAMRDLELRGAGNILGTEQSGHMVTVGYELYCKLLEETMRVYSGERSPEELPDTSIEIDINAYIPEEYISDEIQRIEVYQKTAAIVSEDEKMEMIDELLDRFGDLPKSVQNLIVIAQIKAGAKELGIEKVEEKNGQIILTFLNQNKLEPKMIYNMVKNVGSRAVVNGGRKPFIKYKVQNGRKKAEEILSLINYLREKPEEDVQH